MPRIVYTQESLLNLEEIYLYSLANWGEKVADSYQLALLESLTVLEEYPDLLKQSGFSDAIRVYFIEQHTLFFSIAGEELLLLAVKYGAMDAKKIIKELEPALIKEAAAMRNVLQKNHDH